MKILEFSLSGETAFFKIPDVNSYRFLTYSSIHKIALLGIFGSILGLKGYSVDQDSEFPEFYNELKNIRCSIEVINPISISKKYQQFNNSVGYASYEQGNNLIVTEQWLERPEWIVRLDQDSVPKNMPLVQMLLDNKSIYIPYLGNNDHFATIKDIMEKELYKVDELNGEIEIDGLFIDETFNVLSPRRTSSFYKYSEYLPVELDEKFNHYISKKLTQTNGQLEVLKNDLDVLSKLGRFENKYFYFI